MQESIFMTSIYIYFSADLQIPVTTLSVRLANFRFTFRFLRTESDTSLEHLSIRSDIVDINDRSGYCKQTWKGWSFEFSTLQGKQLVFSFHRSIKMSLLIVTPREGRCLHKGVGTFARIGHECVRRVLCTGWRIQKLWSSENRCCVCTFLGCF